MLKGMLRHGTCLTTRPKLDDLLDSELPAATRERVRRHLLDCRSCSRQFVALSRAVEKVRDLGAEPPRTIPSVVDEIARRLVEVEGHEPD